MSSPEEQFKESKDQTVEHTESTTVDLEPVIPELSTIQKITESIRNYIAGINWQALPADATTRVTFSLLSGIPIELIAGMEWDEIATSRAISLPIVVLTSPIYRKFSQWPLKKFGITMKDHRAQFIASNMITYATFYCTQYAAFCHYVIKTTPTETAIATTELALFSFPLGAAYGYWQDLIHHRVFKLPREIATNKEEITKD